VSLNENKRVQEKLREIESSIMESKDHILLCKKLKEDIHKNLRITDDGSWSSGTVAFHCLPNTKKINGFIPDLKYVHKENIIAIGDAKNRNDIKNNHTVKQIRAYLCAANGYKERHMFFRVPAISFAKTVNFIFQCIQIQETETCFYINGRKVF